MFCWGAGSANEREMQTRAVLLSLFAVTGLAAPENKAVLSLYPAWTTIFEGDSVTLMCDVPDSAKEALYTWYRNSSILTKERGKYKYHLPNAKTSDNGEYSCEAFGSGRSDPVRLTVSNDWVILQAPYSPVFDGEPLILRCLGFKGFSVSSVSFYKDDQRLRRHQDQQTLSIPYATVIDDSGTYTCEMQLGSLTYNYKSAAVDISVREPFPPPLLEVKPSASPTEGSSILLMCKTELAVQKQHTKLLFTFYKDWQVLVQKSDSPEYNIKHAQLENSGEYFCQAETENLRWRKQSSQLQIQVQRPRNPFETISNSQTSAASSPLLSPMFRPPVASSTDKKPPVASFVPPAGSLSFLAEVHFCSSLLKKSEEGDEEKRLPSQRGSSTVLEKCRDEQLRVFCEGIVGRQVKNSMEENAEGDGIPFLMSIKNLVKAIQEQKTVSESVAGRESAQVRPACATNSSLLQQINQSVQDLNTDAGKIALEMQTMNSHLANIANSLQKIASSLTKDPLNVST
ncbi:high affinity immunoglobulin gamma Fc receptor I isoform X2 [Microcaecilia unicolor]|uniref:high affinity immunoglobulin gamma Fc receptor I-like isoform X2 n=1 Tax=Microcaecilia unicolor TaxID=1415580 RepID=UPI0011861BE5|nr:high affinity immunoglobulin gamma Fc receptor I-like isoform X2 [Microcaecilia unicolor]